MQKCGHNMSHDFAVDFLATSVAHVHLFVSEHSTKSSSSRHGISCPQIVAMP